MGMTAKEFMNFKENESEQRIQEMIDDRLFKPYNIMVKGKFEYYNGENKMRYFAVKVYPHNIQNENKALLSRLSVYENKEDKKENVNMEGEGDFNNGEQENQFNQFGNVGDYNQDGYN